MKQIISKIIGSANYLNLARGYHQIKIFLHNVIHPYKFDEKNYAGTFLGKEVSYQFMEERLDKVDRVIYIFWTGDNEITPNRMAGIKSLERCSGVKVQLITPENVDKYIVEDDPLPDAYKYLSLVHRADYLRSYFMYHHGGGYADIKTYYHSWVSAFDKLDASDAYVIGYPEVGFWGAAWQDIEDENLRRDVCYHWRKFIGNGAYICRHHTKFTYEWYEEAKRRLIHFSESLEKHPAKDPRGMNVDYPIRWSGLLGSIFHPLCLKYSDKLLKDKSLMPSFENYR